MKNKKLHEFFGKLKFKLENGTEKEKESAKRILMKLKVSMYKANIETLHDMYNYFKNPIYCLEAYSYCRKHNLKIPNWVVNYIDDINEKLLKRCKSDEKGSHKKFNDDIGIHQKEINEYNSRDTREKIYDLVITKRKDLKYGEKDSIFKEVVDELKLNLEPDSLKRYLSTEKGLINLIDSN